MSYFSQYRDYFPEISLKSKELLDLFFKALVEEAMPAGMIGKNDSVELLWARHILDSLLPLQSERVLEIFTKGNVYDLGSGAGLPGLVLAACFPEVQFYLADISEKRTLFLERMKFRLSLDNVEVIRTRIEEFPEGKYPEANIVLFRAFVKPLAALELSLRIFKGTGVQKGKVLYWRSRPFDSFREEKGPPVEAGVQKAAIERLNHLGFSDRYFIDLKAPPVLERRGIYLLEYRGAKPGFPRSWKKMKKDILLEQVL